MNDRTLMAAGEAMERFYPAYDLAGAAREFEDAFGESRRGASVKAQTADPADVPAAIFGSTKGRSNRGLSGRAGRLLIVAICFWSLVESPFEAGAGVSSSQLLALACSKAIVILIGAAAIAELRFSRRLFSFLCGVSLLAIAPALPEEFRRSLELSCLSAIECVLKAAFILVFCFHSIQKRRPKGAYEF